MGAKCVSVCLSVPLLVSKTTCQKFGNFLLMLPVAMARSFSDDSRIRMTIGDWCWRIYVRAVLTQLVKLCNVFTRGRHTVWSCYRWRHASCCHWLLACSVQYKNRQQSWPSTVALFSLVRYWHTCCICSVRWSGWISQAGVGASCSPDCFDVCWVTGGSSGLHETYRIPVNTNSCHWRIWSSLEQLGEKRTRVTQNVKW